VLAKTLAGGRGLAAARAVESRRARTSADERRSAAPALTRPAQERQARLVDSGEDFLAAHLKGGPPTSSIGVAASLGLRTARVAAQAERLRPPRCHRVREHDSADRADSERVLAHLEQRRFRPRLAPVGVNRHECPHGGALCALDFAAETPLEPMTLEREQDGLQRYERTACCAEDGERPIPFGHFGRGWAHPSYGNTTAAYTLASA
jgi:hypothetical protein